MKRSRMVSGFVVLCAFATATTGCKSRFFFFGEETNMNTNQPNPSEETRANQVAIGSQSSSNATPQTQSGTANQATAPYAPLQGVQKKIALGSTQQFEVNGQRVDVTFEQVLEDSRCPKNVVCIWAGQARLQFALSVPALNLSKKVTPILSAGQPQMGQAVVGSVGLELIALTPDTIPADQKSVTPEATIVVGKAP